MTDARARVTVEQHARDTALYRVFDALRVGVAVCLADGAVVEANDALLELLGLVDQQQAVGRTLEALLDGELVVGAPGGADRYERSARRRDGSLAWVRVTRSRVVGADGRVLLLVQSVEDLTEAKARERDLHERALLDAVTGLPNRYLAMDRLEHALALRERDGRRLGVLFVDLDGFKAVNDADGHGAGDAVLREAARRIRRAARSADTVARWGGDEFVVVCDALAGARDAQLVARRVAASLAEPFVLDEGVFRLTASVGSAVTAPGRTALAADLLEEADLAMYDEKRARRSAS